MNLIKQWQANASANILDTTSITANFDTYMITLENVFPSSTTTSPLLFQVYSSTGAATQITSYLTATSLNNAGTNTGLVNTTGVQIGSTLQAAATPGINGVIFLSGSPMVSSASMKQIWAQTGGQSATPTAQMVTASGYWNTAGLIAGFRLIFGTSGSVVNISSGIVRVYGINTA